MLINVRVSRALRAGGLASLVANAVLPAQAAGTLTAGARVRVQRAMGYRTATHVGELVSVSPESVSYRDERTRAVVVLARDSILSVDQSVLDGNHTVDGAVLGMLGGIVIGGLAGYGFARSDCTASTSECLQGPWLLVGGGVGGVFGLLAGAVFGSHIDSERWEPVQLPQRIGFVPHFERRKPFDLSVHFAY